MGSADAKRAAGEAAANLVAPRMLVGLGTGSTAAFFHEALARRNAAENLGVRCIPTSEETARRALALGLELVDLGRHRVPDLTVDGADEIGPNLGLVKGGGGALVREKIVAAASRRLVVIADATKRVRTLGAYPLPVAVVPFATERVVERLKELFEVMAVPRVDAAGEPVVTDDQLAILDLHFGTIPRPALLETRLRQIVGVVESGLFVGLAHEALVAGDDGSIVRLTPDD